MRDEKITKIEYSLEDLKREDIRALVSYIDITNRFLKTIIPILGVESCRAILITLNSEHEILKYVEISDNGVMTYSKVVETLKKQDEYTGLTLVSSAFSNVISNLMEAYNAMVSPQLGVTALLTAASEAEAEKLKEIERAKAELEKANAELAELAKSLEKKVEDKTRQLEEYAQLLQSAKMVALGQLSATVAHELNNPIGVILGFTQFILNKLSTNSEFTAEDFKNCTRYIEYIEKEATRCKEIVETILSFSRKHPAIREPIDIKEVIERSLLMTRPQLESHNIRLATNYESKLPRISGNANQLQQAFINLIINAQQAMPNSGELNICAKTKKEGGNKALVISFKDTGCGIPKDNLERIFEPFFTTKKDWRSIGLGLSIVYQIVQDHKGTITVESEEGKGTTFTITLPC